MRAQGTSGAPRRDQELWRRSQDIEASLDETENFLDLAAFAENRLDDDDTARIAALIARDAAMAEDVAAARAPTAVEMVAAEDVIARAAGLVAGGRSEAMLIAFPAPWPARKPWYGAATWSGLAAAIAFAGWLGFDLGSGLSNTPLLSRGGDEPSASELLDPAPLMLRDFTENSQI